MNESILNANNSILEQLAQAREKAGQEKVIKDQEKREALEGVTQSRQRVNQEKVEKERERKEVLEVAAKEVLDMEKGNQVLSEAVQKDPRFREAYKKELALKEVERVRKDKELEEAIKAEKIFSREVEETRRSMGTNPDYNLLNKASLEQSRLHKEVSNKKEESRLAKQDLLKPKDRHFDEEKAINMADRPMEFAVNQVMESRKMDAKGEMNETVPFYEGELKRAVFAEQQKRERQKVEEVLAREKVLKGFSS